MSTQTKVAYDSTFFDQVAQGTKQSAEVIVPLVHELLQPSSVLDVGCATGTWLAEWRRAGVKDTLGVDGDYVDRSALLIPMDSFQPVDLRHNFSLDRKFDVVQTLEVAEHLDEASADGFVESLSRHGDVVLFSAAIPGQGGTHHVNEQWPSYWAAKFEKAGFSAYDVIRPQIWTDPRVLFFYRQNMLIFARNRVFDGAMPRLDLVHPDMWESDQAYRRLLHDAPGLVARRVRRALGRA